MLFADLMGFYNNPAHDTELMFSAAMVFGILVLIVSRGHRYLKGVWAVTVIMLIFPAFGTVLNGMSYANNRWCYAAAMLAAWTFVCIFAEKKENSSPDDDIRVMTFDPSFSIKRALAAFAFSILLVVAGCSLGYLSSGEAPSGKNIRISFTILAFLMKRLRSGT
jgi:glycerol uptake facilitator-like aquaporin